MSDFKPWLEAELARQLGPVRAPESLWTAVQSGARHREPRIRMSLVLWPVVALMLLVASGDLAWQVGKSRQSLSCRSSDPSEVRAWVKAHSGIDVELSCGRSENARLVGASVTRKPGAVMAAISYKVGSDDATVLVSDKREYMIEYSGARDAEGACVRCHLEGHRQL
jgi:hypothetical protein